jgi:hypothetical protein
LEQKNCYTINNSLPLYKKLSSYLLGGCFQIDNNKIEAEITLKKLIIIKKVAQFIKKQAPIKD